jgi:RNA polymerase sigma factor (sigma-70 family)
MLMMATTTLGAALHNLRRSLRRKDEGLTDGELLECFVTRRDEDAFAALVRRHGPMVLGVCRRVLRNEADAEDAFQATFFVLVRKAASIRPPGMVGNWLYGVAHTTALKVKAMSTKRLAKEREAAARSKPDVTGETWQELQALLDQELKVLPDIYRAAIVLCDLEGKSIKEAARQLGCPQGTVGTRLARGRILLSRRLARHRLALSGGLTAMVIAQNVAAAGVPPLLMN